MTKILLYEIINLLELFYINHKLLFIDNSAR